MPTRTIADGAAVVEEILDYAENVGRVRCRLSRCPACNAPADGPAFFTRHDIRSRTFWVTVERVVEKIPCLLTRWKGPCCKRPFTLQPPFAFPYKRYTLPQMLGRAEEYTVDDAVSYCEAVKQDGMPVCHEQECDAAHLGQSDGAGHGTAAEASEGDEEMPTPVRSSEACEAEKEDDGTSRQLRGSTLHRWITTLGGLTRTVGRALVLIRQKGAAPVFFRSLASIRIAAGKYRSEGRKEILRMCRVLARVAPMYERIFAAKFFPIAATASGWT